MLTGQNQNRHITTKNSKNKKAHISSLAERKETQRCYNYTKSLRNAKYQNETTLSSYIFGIRNLFHVRLF